MIDIITGTMDTSGVSCYNSNCKSLPEYTESFGNGPCIKKGTPYAMITLNMITLNYATDSTINYYCRDCIDYIYKLMKSQIDTNLWAFR